MGTDADGTIHISLRYYFHYKKNFTSFTIIAETYTTVIIPFNSGAVSMINCSL